MSDKYLQSKELKIGTDTYSNHRRQYSYFSMVAIIFFYLDFHIHTNAHKINFMRYKNS